MLIEKKKNPSVSEPLTVQTCIVEVSIAFLALTEVQILTQKKALKDPIESLFISHYMVISTTSQLSQLET